MRGNRQAFINVCVRTDLSLEEGGLGLDIYFSNLVSTSAMRVPPARARSWAPRCSYSANALRLRAKPNRPTSSRATWRGESDRSGVLSGLLEELIQLRGVSFRSPSCHTHTLIQMMTLGLGAKLGPAHQESCA